MKTKLKDILNEVFEKEPQINKKEVVEAVSQYGVVGKALSNSQNILEIAEKLVDMAESAHNHVLSETDDWFDKVSINRNMKSLSSMVKEFKKTAMESSTLGQRMQTLYEDMGVILNRYYDISEGLDPVDPEKVEPEDDFKDREDKDIDNDGDTDDSDKYLHNRRKTVTKAVKIGG